MKKFELITESKINRYGRTLFRIKACISFTTATGDEVKAGDLGGYLEKESNLSQDGNAWVYDNAEVYDNARVYGNAEVCGNAWVYDNARVYGNAEVCGDARVYGDAWVTKNTNFLTVGPIGSRNGFTTFFNGKDGGISVKCGCFCGKIDAFLKKVRQTHGDNKHAEAYIAAAALAEIQVEHSEEGTE